MMSPRQPSENTTESETEAAAPGRTLSRREALWRSAALAAAGLLTTRTARAQSIPSETDAVVTPPPAESPADPAAPPPAEAAGTDAGTPVTTDPDADPATDPVEDWTIDPEEAPAAALEASYFEARRAAEAAELAGAEEIQAEVLEAAALESRYNLEFAKLDVSQEGAEQALELALETAGAAGATGEVAALDLKLRQVREAHRVNQERLTKRRQADLKDERLAKAKSSQVRQRQERVRKAELQKNYDLMARELRQQPDRVRQEARQKERMRQRETIRRDSEKNRKARQLVRADRQATDVEQKADTQFQQLREIQREVRIKQEKDYKKAQQQIKP